MSDESDRTTRVDNVIRRATAPIPGRLTVMDQDLALLAEEVTRLRAERDENVAECHRLRNEAARLQGRLDWYEQNTDTENRPGS